jgi:hypothetical protein
MKTFQEFMVECYSVDEATIHKQVRNTQEKDTAMISRDRGSQSERQNRKERRPFERTLRRSGHGFSKNVGSYDEGGGKGMDTEVSYQVTRNPKKNSRKGFERKMRNLGKKKGPSGEAQHSVLHKEQVKMLNWYQLMVVEKNLLVLEEQNMEIILILQSAKLPQVK